MKIPENCPIQEILKQLSLVLGLLDKILDHCQRCMKEQGKEDESR